MDFTSYQWLHAAVWTMSSRSRTVYGYRTRVWAQAAWVLTRPPRSPALTLDKWLPVSVSQHRAGESYHMRSTQKAPGRWSLTFTWHCTSHTFGKRRLTEESKTTKSGGPDPCIQGHPPPHSISLPEAGQHWSKGNKPSPCCINLELWNSRFLGLPTRNNWEKGARCPVSCWAKVSLLDLPVTKPHSLTSQFIFKVFVL